MKALFITTAVIASSSVLAADYQVDPTHSAVTFEIGHLGISTTVGRFNDFEGAFSYDENGKSGDVEFTIQAASVDTNHDKRDEHIRGSDFLDVEKFPTLTFKSTSFDGEELTGDLTLHGVTKPVTFEVEKEGEGEDPWGGYRVGFEASTTIKRSDFGITSYIPGVTDETEIDVFIEGIRQ